jgi:hypothetical protein
MDSILSPMRESISACNWTRIPKLALPVLGSRDLTPIESDFGEDTTRRLGQNGWDQFVTGVLQ